MTQIDSTKDNFYTQKRSMPPLGGYNLTFLKIEILRLLRNRRNIIFTIITPVVFYFMFGGGKSIHQKMGNGNASSYVMISLAVYGAMIATTATGASVAVERAAGWSRQLRITPLRPGAYIAIKISSALIMGVFPVVAVFVTGALNGAQMTFAAWIISGFVAIGGALVFVPFGLFAGYLMPSESVMQILGPVLAILAFVGGLFVPMAFLNSTFRNIAKFTPAYGIGEIARSPMMGHGFDIASVANVIIWMTIFAFGAAMLFRRDTGRV